MDLHDKHNLVNYIEFIDWPSMVIPSRFYTFHKDFH